MGEVSSETEGVAFTELLCVSLLGNSTMITLELTKRGVPSAVADGSMAESTRLLYTEESWPEAKFGLIVFEGPIVASCMDDLVIKLSVVDMSTEPYKLAESDANMVGRVTSKYKEERGLGSYWSVTDLNKTSGVLSAPDDVISLIVLLTPSTSATICGVSLGWTSMLEESFEVNCESPATMEGLSKVEEVAKSSVVLLIPPASDIVDGVASPG